MKRLARVCIAGLCLATLLGCRPYVLRGQVVEGQTTLLQLREGGSSNPNLLPISGATVELTLDPNTLGRRPIGSAGSNDDGTFAIPVDLVGAGVLEYEVQITVRCEGYTSAQETMLLPRPGRWVWVVLKPGEDRRPRAEDPLGDVEPFLPRK